LGITFKKKRKKTKDKSRKVPYVYANTTQVKHWEWCIKNRIGVCVVPDWDTADKWKIEIILKDKTSIDPNQYEGVEALAKMYEYCEYYYNKHNKNGEKI
tara:strand:+ start:1569 stop:1865 length:297 start_codon:yes stop_codon:yes gene_type:complete